MKHRLWFYVLIALLSVIFCAVAFASPPEYCHGCSPSDAPNSSFSLEKPGNGTHVYVCMNCGDEYPEYCSGGTATCTEKAVCSVCGMPYGETGEHTPGADATCTEAQVCTVCGTELAPALGHDWKDGTCTRCGATETTVEAHHWKKSKVIEPTCTEKGYTKYVCTDCDKTKKADYVDALGHRFGPWTGNGDGTHSATCVREGCKHESTRDCALLTVTTSDDVLSFCPVCGEFGADKAMTVLEGAKVENVDKNAKPHGEAVVFGVEKPFDEVLYAFTVAQEYGGKPEEYKGTVAVSVPLEMEEDFRLVRVDVRDDAPADEYAETWTELDSDYKDGVLSFHTDKAGLFLLVSED